MAAPSTLDREAIEAALPWNLRAALPDICRLFGVAREDWPASPLLAEFVPLVAAAVLRDRGIRAGHSRTAALESACIDIGLSPGAARKRFSRARKAYAEAGGGGDVLSREREKRAVASEQ